MSQRTKTTFTNDRLINYLRTLGKKPNLAQKQQLLNLYDVYKNNYFKFYVQNLEEENAILKQAFSNVDFYILSRVKSKHNYKEKIEQKGDAFDIFGDKIIILSANGKTDESSLIKTAYEMERFLVSYNPNITEIHEKRKDYIACPKDNGYSSLHITRTVYVEDENIAFNHETQIKTFRMRETEKDGTASHSTVYKANRGICLNNISSPKSAEYFLPLYMHFEFDKRTRKDKLVIDSFENRFRYYFHEDYEEFLKQRNDCQR